MVARKILKEVAFIAALVGGMFLIFRFVLMNVYVPTTSMSGTIEADDRLIANRLAYTFSDPKRGDIIVFDFPLDPDTEYVKRVIGLPGETVTIDDGTVYVDGEPITEDYLVYDWTTKNDGYEFEVPEDSLFVMGDNRDGSYDSRDWGYVRISAVRAKVIIKYWKEVEILG